MKVASYALPSSAIIFLIVVADLRGFTNKCMMYISIPIILFDSVLNR